MFSLADLLTQHELTVQNHIALLTFYHSAKCLLASNLDEL